MKIMQTSYKPFYRFGFTLIELMIVVAIIGLLAAIAVPKFADLVVRSQEASTKGSLGGLRSAVMIYYAGTGGIFPGDINTGLVPTYINQMPIAYRSGNHPTASTAFVSYGGGGECLDESGFRIPSVIDGYGWCYMPPDVNSLKDGLVCVMCDHEDSRGYTWSRF